MQQRAVRGVISALVLCSPLAARAAAITGTISVSAAPPAVLAAVLSDRHVCGESGPVYDRRVEVDEAGHAKGVIVSLERLDGGSPGPPRRGHPPPVVIDQQNCTFVPRVTAAEIGAELRFKNSDPLLHNVHAIQGGKTIANFAMPVKGSEVSAGFLIAAGDVELRCDAGHRWMRSLVRVFAHPRFAESDAGGRFRIAGLLPGRYRAIAWHPDLGERSAEVEIRWQGEEHVISFRF